MTAKSTQASMTTEKKSETSPLVEAFRDGYGTDCHAQFVEAPAKVESSDHPRTMLIDYEPLKLSTFRVCCAIRGTVLGDPVLFLEQVFITLLFAVAAGTTYYYFNKVVAGGTGSGGKDESLAVWLNAQEGKMRAFAMIMTNLSGFLLSMYTAVCVGRWWVMRTAGIGGIKAATLDLEWLLSSNVTDDEQILSAVRRYGRASLLLLFLWRSKSLGNLKQELVDYSDILTAEEAERLEELRKKGIFLHETIWAWQGSIVTALYKTGKIKSDELFRELLTKCCEGRQAVQVVHTHLAVRVPMQYVHLLGLLVKLHNTVLAVVMGVMFGVAVREQEIIICIQTFARTLLLPFIFNAILLINCDLQDPFEGSAGDFPGQMYQKGLERDCKGFVDAGKEMPAWVRERKQSV